MKANTLTLAGEVIATPVAIQDLSETDYHADTAWDAPSLSSSLAGVLDKRSAAHAFAKHPKLGGEPWEETEAGDRGTIIHELLLNKGAGIVVVPADDWRTNAAKALRDKARAEGKTPVLPKHYEPAENAAMILRSRFGDLGIVLDGDSEVSVFWEEESPFGLVPCRGRLDHVRPGGATIYDLKSTRDASPDAIRRSIEKFGYDIQGTAYTSASEKIGPELAGRLDFVFVFFELDAPHVVTPIRLNGEYAAMGRKKWQRAVDVWGRCLSEKQWPTYAREILTISPPPWAMANLIAREDEEDDS